MNENVNVAISDASGGEFPSVSCAPPADLPFCFGAAGITTLWCFFHGRAGLGVLFIVLAVVFIPLSQAGAGGWLLTEAIGWTISIAMGYSGSQKTKQISIDKMRV